MSGTLLAGELLRLIPLNQRVKKVLINGACGQRQKAGKSCFLPSLPKKEVLEIARSRE
jgi:hypothetical protein